MKVYKADTNFCPIGSGEPRSEGLHLTDVIKSIEKEMGWDYKGKGFHDSGLTMELGFVWEQHLSNAMADRWATFRPGEVVKDGIIGSPDAIGPNPGLIDEEGNVLVEPSTEIILEEYKYTWKSSKNQLEDNWYYLTQGKAYCYMVGVTACLWRACYNMGNWGDHVGPLYRQVFIRFDQDELDENWAMIINHAKEKGMLK